MEGREQRGVGEWARGALRSWLPYDIYIYMQSTAFLSMASSMNVPIKKEDGETITLDVAASDTIGAIKAKLEQWCGVPVKRQILWYVAYDMEDTEFLSDYNYRVEDNIVLEVERKATAEEREQARKDLEKQKKWEATYRIFEKEQEQALLCSGERYNDWFPKQPTFEEWLAKRAATSEASSSMTASSSTTAPPTGTTRSKITKRLATVWASRSKRAKGL